MNDTTQGDLTQEKALQIIEANRKILYHIPSGYPTIRYYLGSGYLRETLLKILLFLRNLYRKQDGENHIIIEDEKYEFFIANTKLSFYVRKSSGTGTSNRHINFLCAMGVFHKTPQGKDFRLIVNENMKAKDPKKRDLNIYSLRELTQNNLTDIEKRSERLKRAGITAGNLSFNQLRFAIPDLLDIAKEVYPDRRTRKPVSEITEFRQYVSLKQCIDLLIDTYGYANKALIYDNLTLPEAQIDKIFRIFKKHLYQKYRYKRPCKTERKTFGLQDQRYIFLRKKEEL